MLHRLHLLFLLAAACGLVAAGCGGGDTPDTKGEAQQKCLDAAEKLTDPEARKIAQEGCNGDADKASEAADKVRDDAVKQCLDAVKDLPSDQRKRAQRACKAAQ